MAQRAREERNRLSQTGPAWLFCPADRPERFEKAAAAADVVILDLEDGVAAKDREAARAALIDTPLDPDRTVDAYVVPHHLGVDVLSESFVGCDQTARSFGANFAVVEILAIDLGIRVDIRLLLCDALIEVLALQRLVRGRTESFAGRPLLGGRIALVEHVVNATVDQGVLGLELVQVVRFVGQSIRCLGHASRLARQP